MKPSDTPNTHPRAVLREGFDDYAVLFQPLFGEAFGLDQVGLFIWKLLDGRRTLAQVADQVAARFQDAPASVLEDTLAFAQELHRRLLVVAQPEEAEWGQEPSLARSLPDAPRDAFHFQSPAFGLSLADGTRLALRAGDRDAARVISFLAEAAQLAPLVSPPPPGTRRLLAVTGVEPEPWPGDKPRPQMRYVSPLSAAAATDAAVDFVCVLEPTDAKRFRRWPIEEATRDLSRSENPLFALEPLSEEQWLWQQLVRLSAAVSRETHPRGGVLVHSGLAAVPSLPWGEGADRRPAGEGGILLAGRSGVGKSTASQRLPLPWRSLADDVTLVVCNGDGDYLAHPWPTWSRLIGEEAWPQGYSWDVQQTAVPLRAIFFLEQDDQDRVEPLGAGHALCGLVELAQQTSLHLLQDLPLNEITTFHQQRFDNLCALVQAVPAYVLHASLDGAFWQEIERVL